MFLKNNIAKKWHIDDSTTPQKRDTEKVLNQKISGVIKIKIRGDPESAEKKIKKDGKKERKKDRNK
jgi:hypothetical protein